MPTNPYEPPKEVLCDTCRQNVAVRHFHDPDYAGLRHGVVIRHLCVACPYPISAVQLIELHKYLFANGACEECGGPPVSIAGIPGPDRKMLCAECVKQQYGGASAWPASEKG